MSIERQGGQRILVGTPAVLRVAFYRDGVVVDPGTVTVSIVRMDGTPVTESPVETQVDGASFEVTYDLPAEQTAALDLLTVTWTSESLGAVTTRVEIVGDRLFTIAEARRFDGEVLKSESKFPTTAIEEARSRIEDAFERICGVSFIPRLERRVVDGGSGSLLTPHLFVRSVRRVEHRTSAGWEELNTAVITPAPGGILEQANGMRWPAGRQNLRVTYVHGHEHVPLDVRRAGLILARYELVESNLSDRATSFSDESGTYRIATAGLTRGSWFGLPLVDSVLQRHVLHIPAVG